MTSFDRFIILFAGLIALLIGGLIWYGESGIGGLNNQEPLVLYLAEDANGRYQLMAINPKEEQPLPLPLTAVETDILDFAIAPSGQQIALTIFDPDGSHDLWLLDTQRLGLQPLLDCVEISCTNPVWSPSDGRLLYERRNLPAPNSPPGPARLWWLDTTTRQTVSLFSDSQYLGLGASFSPDGEWLAFVVPLIEEVQAYHIPSGRIVSLPSRTGEAPVWGPNNALYFTEVQFQGESLAVHLYRADLETQAIENLSGEAAVVNDGTAAWVPSAEWVALTRKPARTPAGKQLWLMRPDGSEQHSLTDNFELHNGIPSWSADGQQLIFQRYDLQQPYAQPQIWLYDLASGQEMHLATPGTRPQWLP